MDSTITIYSTVYLTVTEMYTTQVVTSLVPVATSTFAAPVNANFANVTPVMTTEYITNTVYESFTTCAPSVTACSESPAAQTVVTVTRTVDVYTTVYPTVATTAIETETVYQTILDTVATCNPSYQECPLTTVTRTSTYAVYTTVFAMQVTQTPAVKAAAGGNAKAAAGGSPKEIDSTSTTTVFLTSTIKKTTTVPLVYQTTMASVTVRPAAESSAAAQSSASTQSVATAQSSQDAAAQGAARVAQFNGGAAPQGTAVAQVTPASNSSSYYVPVNKAAYALNNIKQEVKTGAASNVDTYSLAGVSSFAMIVGLFLVL